MMVWMYLQFGVTEQLFTKKDEGEVENVDISTTGVRDKNASDS